MRERGWLHECRRRPKGLTKATTEIQEKENLIKQNFHSDRPYQKLLTDISQIPCIDGTLYISPIMDCFNGEILSLCIRNNMRKELCVDNVRMESFFATLKKELLYRIPTYRMKMNDVKAIIFKYVFTYYNQVRIYTSNPEGLPPAAYRRLTEDYQLLAA